MQHVIKYLFLVLGDFSPSLASKLAYYLFFKPFRLTSHPLDLKKKKEGTQLDFVISGKKTSAWYWGEGPVIVLVHGWSSKGFHYRKLIDPLLTLGFTVVIPDMPGHVNSEGKSSNVLEFKETIGAILKHFDGAYALVGHSLGAMACALLLAENQYKVEKLVILNAAVYADSIMTRFMEQIGGNNRVKEAMLKRLKVNFKQDFSEYSIMSIVQRINIQPKYMVVGDENDPEVGIDEVTSFANAMEATLLVTKGLGHNGGLKDDEVVKAITTFLA